jgi:multiple sugar transport system permease protein
MARVIPRQAAVSEKPFWNTERRESFTGWLFASPWIIGFIVFTAGPMLFSVYTSFTRYNITSPPQWIGTRNYVNLFNDPNFYVSLRNTFWMVAFKTPLVVVVSIAIALLLNMDLPGGKAFRTIFYLPNVLAGVAAVFLWRWILAPQGLFNRGLGLFGIEGPAWFVDPQWTKPGLVVMGMWWIGGNVLIYLASLKGIPRSMYEAAEIDGATGWKSTWYITLPMLSPTIFFQVVTGIIGVFQIFSTALIITGTAAGQGGPGKSLLFYVLYLYARAFNLPGSGSKGTLEMGYGAAMAWILFIIILAVTMVQLWFAKRWVYYESDR